MGKDGGQGKFFPKYKRVASHLNSLCTCIMLIPQSCLTLCNLMDCSLSGSSVHGLVQARILECVVISFSSVEGMVGGKSQGGLENWLINPVAKLSLGYPSGSDGKASACNAGDLGSIPGLGRSPGEGKAAHSSILALKIPWTAEPGRLPSTGSQSRTRLSNFTFTSC